MANPTKQPFKIGLYIRVSTEEQAQNPEGSDQKPRGPA